MAISSIEEIPTPRGVTRLQVEDINSPTEINSALNNLYDFSRDVADYFEEQYQILHNGALVRSWQVEELLAGSIGAGTITTDQIYIGDDRFEISGVLGRIQVRDDGGIVMFEAGNFLGVDWGIKIRDASNAIVFQALSNGGVTMDGAIITNATIVDAQIVDVDGNKLTGTGFIEEDMVINGAVTVNKINVATLSGISANIGTITAGTINATVSVNAGAINTGTITVDGSPAMNVTSGGAAIFSSGGDIEMRANGTDFNYIKFQTSGASNRATLGYNSTNNDFTIATSASCDLSLASNDVIDMTAVGNVNITAGQVGSGTFDVEADIISLEANNGNCVIGSSSGGDIRTTGDIIAAADSTDNLGSASIKFATVYRDAEGDIPMRNAFVITEPDLVSKHRDRDSGLCIMRRTKHIKGKHWEWEQVAEFGNDGTFYCKRLVEVEGFPKPDFPYRGDLEVTNTFHDEVKQ